MGEYRVGMWSGQGKLSHRMTDWVVYKLDLEAF